MDYAWFGAGLLAMTGLTLLLGRWAGVGLGLFPLWAIGRAVVQLTVVALLLRGILSVPWTVAGFILLMLTTASWTAMGRLRELWHGRRTAVLDELAAGLLERSPTRGLEQHPVVDVVVGAVDLLGQPDQQEGHGAEREQQHDQPEDPATQVGPDLPHVGIDEQERHEDQQQRQGPGGGREQRSQAAERAGQGPGHDRPRPQRGEGVPTGGQQQQREQDRWGERELVGDPGDCSARAGRRQPQQHHQRQHPARSEAGADRGSLLGHEVRQAVVQEPRIGGLHDPRRDTGSGHARAPRSSRARSTSSRICSTSSSTEPKAAMPRSRSTKETTTSTPYSSRSVRSST